MAKDLKEKKIASSDTAKKTRAKAKKTTQSKVVTKTLPKKTVRKAPLKSKAASTKKKAVKRSTKSPTLDEVKLPNRMPMRAQEKALVLSERFERDFYPAAVLLSRVCGIAFVITGGVLSLSSLQTTTSTACVSGCAAQAGASVDLLTIQPASTVGSVKLLGALPSRITSEVTVPIQVSGAADVTATLHFVTAAGDKKIIPLTTASLSNEKYSIEILGGILEPSLYTLKVEARFAGSDKYKTFTLGTFSSKTTASDPAVTVETGTSTTIVSDQQIRIENQKPVNTSVFSLSVSKDLSKISRVSIASNETFTEVEFFARPIQSPSPQFVGSVVPPATIFSLNTYNLPNGTYELFAKGSRSGKSTIQSDSAIVEIFNPESISKSGEVTADQERQLLTISRELNQELYENFEEGPSVDESVALLADQRLTRDEETLDSLLQAYAVAKQAEDDTLITAAEAAISDYRKSVVSEALLDESDRYVADELDRELETKLSRVKKKIETFENLRKERTESDSSQDTDNDGVSDIDETVLYGTDPTMADSDGDGFTDGAEIIKGYDPLDAAVEVLIDYESPKETVVAVRSEKLQVLEVEPEIVLETASTTQEVHTIVRGKALPNSFVTLYVFSTPTIVTVRTDADGTFEYTFTKELEDGEHQVFVALTDNSGEIVAQSEAFTFVKEAQAFTLVETAQATAEAEPAIYIEQETEGSSYRIAIGMSVLAFGILLIMLGIGLRGNKPDIVTEE